MSKEGGSYAKPPWSRKEDGMAFGLNGATLRRGYTFSCSPGYTFSCFPAHMLERPSLIAGCFSLRFRGTRGFGTPRKTDLPLNKLTLAGNHGQRAS